MKLTFLPRYLVTGTLAVATTFAVFLFMHALISEEMSALEEDRHGRMIDFVRLKRESQTRTKDRDLPQKTEPPKPPPPPKMEQSRSSKPSSDVAAIAPAFDLDVDLGEGPYLGAAPSDTDAIPLVRVNPQYPVVAAQRGIEGWALVEFTISAAGTVKNPRVLDSEPGSIFDRAALRAISRWKYKPKIVDGAAVERPGITVRLTFELEN